MSASTEQFIALDNAIQACLDAGEDEASLRDHINDVVDDWVTERDQEEEG